MEKLFSPWRSSYIESFKTPSAETGCVFCNALKSKDDASSLVVWRGKQAFVVMNKFPYNSGHMMVVPKRHTAEFLSLSTDELAECMKLLQAGHQALQELCSPHGYNIGLNLGRAAGAGIDGHLHWHILPRWNGDTNFMPTIAEVKLVSEDMTKQQASLQVLFTKILGKGE